MTDYTPSFREVKSMYEEGKLATKGSYEELEFDRWLAKRDAEVVEAERRRIVDILVSGEVLSPEDEVDQYFLEKIREER